MTAQRISSAFPDINQLPLILQQFQFQMVFLVDLELASRSEDA
jgi:hypothetical protein